MSPCDTYNNSHILKIPIINDETQADRWHNSAKSLRVHYLLNETSSVKNRTKKTKKCHFLKTGFFFTIFNLFQLIFTVERFCLSHLNPQFKTQGPTNHFFFLILVFFITDFCFSAKRAIFEVFEFPKIHQLLKIIKKKL